MAKFKVTVHQTLIEEVVEFPTREEANKYIVKEKLFWQNYKKDTDYIWHDVELVEA
jgi:hypothetical protein